MNVPKHVCNHMLGEKHTWSHRAFVGIAVMIAGVLMAKTQTEYFIIHMFCDTAGYLLHGIGAIPILEKISEIHE